MPRFLIRAGKDPRVALTLEQSLASSSVGVFGTNSGNLLFAGAVHRVLSVPGTEVVANSYVHERPSMTDAHVRRIDEEFDHLVLPMANSYRDTFLPHLDRLASVIERVTVPVTVVGIGAQLPYGTSFATLPEDYVRVSKRFTAAVLDHSETIGVRGEYTADMLEHFGFPADRIRVIGCPSMFGWGKQPALTRRVERLDADSPIAISYTPKVAGVADLVEANTERYPRSVVVPQQHWRLALMLWGEDATSMPDPRMPVHTDHPLYRQDRMRFFVDTSTWVDFMRTQHFAFGTRIHGNIAAVLGGTPAVVLAHDSRTAELARYHGIPWRLFSDLPSDVDAQELYEQADLSPFAERQEVGFATFTSFLEENHLPHVYQAGNANPDYDAAIAAAPFPGPAHTLMADGEVGREQVMGRLRWLRQGVTGDGEREPLAFDRPFTGNGPSRRGPALAKEIARLADRVTELEAELAQVRAVQQQVSPARALVRRARRAVRRTLGRQR